MSNQAFYKTDFRLGREVLVQISSCEDRGDFYYICWHPILWFSNGKRVPDCDMIGTHGCSKMYKDGTSGFGKEQFRRAPYKVVDASKFGCGQLALHPLSA